MNFLDHPDTKAVPAIIVSISGDAFTVRFESGAMATYSTEFDIEYSHAEHLRVDARCTVYTDGNQKQVHIEPAE